MAHQTDNLVVRAARPADLDGLHEINQSAVPGVNSLTRDEFQAVEAMSALTLVASRRDVVAGFVLAMTEGLTYASPNYRWLSDRYERFAYVDRVAVAPEARGAGIGQALYEALFRQLSGVRPLVLAEVNLSPPNPGSIKFHDRNGFVSVGERWNEDRSKGVVFLERALT